MITTDFIKRINKDVEQAIQAVADKHSVTIKLGSTRYEPTEYTTKLIVTTKEGEVVRKETEESNSKSYALMLGLPEETLGNIFTMRGETYKVVKVDGRRPKYPIIYRKAKVNDKARYKMTLESYKRVARL